MPKDRSTAASTSPKRMKSACLGVATRNDVADICTPR
jgi:hypothetical protein